MLTGLVLVLAAGVMVVAMIVMVKVLLTLDRILLALDSMQAAAAVVATNLVVAQGQVDGVAEDLADQHDRAGAVADDASPGEAADAASRLPES